MTGYMVHTGSSKQFAEGWDRVFSSAKKKGEKQSAQAKKTSGAKRGKRK